MTVPTSILEPPSWQVVLECCVCSSTSLRLCAIVPLLNLTAPFACQDQALDHTILPSPWCMLECSYKLFGSSLPQPKHSNHPSIDQASNAKFSNLHQGNVFFPCLVCAAMFFGLFLFVTCGLSWLKSVIGTRQSPLMRGRSLRPFVVEVRCTRQSPPTRDRSLRPLVVEVRCM